MTLSREHLVVFNRGLIDSRALARIDVGRVALSAEEQTNWVPSVLGSMSLRPGTEYLGTMKDSNRACYIPFQFDFDDTALLEMTASVMRVWDEGETLVTRNSVSASITNGTFDSDLTGWTDDDDTGAASTWATGGYMQLLGTTYTEAKRYQAVSITETTTEHGLRVVVQRGPLLIRIGTTAGADDVFTQSVLRTGTHSLAFTPGAATIYIEFASSLDYPVLVDSVAVEASGTLELPTPYATTTQLDAMRWATVGNIVFVACDGVQQRRIERRENNSWSVVLYEADDGPFIGPDTSGIRLTPSALSGEITLTASRDLFASTSVGQIFRLTSQGQKVEADVSAEASWSDTIRITGVGADRNIDVAIAGTWVGTVSVQRSIGEEGNWVTTASYTANTTPTLNDGLDNSVVFFRIGIDTGDYTSGTAELSLTAQAGSITGVVRVSAYSSATSVTAQVLTALGGTGATEVWDEGSWSDLYGYPTAVEYYEGRLWWLGRGRAWGSVSDNLTSYDPDFEGDSGPINRAIGKGAVDVINWAVPLQRLLVGSAEAEHSIRSTTFDEPITPTNFNVKEASTYGSKAAPAARIGKRGYAIHRSGNSVFELSFDASEQDYRSEDMTALVPSLGVANRGGSPFSRVAVQQRPDARLWVTRSDGKVAILLRNPIEEVLGWFLIETDGTIEDVAVLPGSVEDKVFLSVKRTIDGSTVRYHEQIQHEDDCIGGTISRQADAALHYSGSSATTITGLSHLEGEDVVAWGNGKDLGDYTVASNQIVLSEAVTEAWIGKGYRARYKSAKLAMQRALGLALGQRSRITKIGLIMENTYDQAVTFGPNFDTMDAMPAQENEDDVTADTVWTAYSEDMIEFPGEWDTDTRVCLEANAPKPATVMGITVNVDVEEEDAGA